MIASCSALAKYIMTIRVLVFFSSDAERKRQTYTQIGSERVRDRERDIGERGKERKTVRDLVHNFTILFSLNFMRFNLFINNVIMESCLTRTIQD